MTALARTALRLAVIPALMADPVIAALCADRVFDSRIYQLTSSDPVPLVVVLTEEEQGAAYSRNNGGPPFDSRIDLVLEISIRAFVPSADGTAFDIATPYLDSEMEASIDLLEDRCINTIAAGDTPAAIAVRTNVLRRIPEMRSGRFVSDDTGVKLAVRCVTLVCEVKGDDVGPFGVDPASPFAVLPDPLRSVAASLDPNSDGYAICQAIAARLSPIAPTPLAGIDITISAAPQFDPTNPPSPPATPPSQSQQSAADPITASIDLT